MRSIHKRTDEKPIRTRLNYESILKFAHENSMSNKPILNLLEMFLDQGFIIFYQDEYQNDIDLLFKHSFNYKQMNPTTYENIKTPKNPLS